MGGTCGAAGFLNVGTNSAALALREKDLALALSLDLDASAGWATSFAFSPAGFFSACCATVLGTLPEPHAGVGGAAPFGVGNTEEYRSSSS